MCQIRRHRRFRLSEGCIDGCGPTQRVSLAKKNGIKTIVDPSVKNFSLSPSQHHQTNLREAAAAVGRDSEPRGSCVSERNPGNNFRPKRAHHARQRRHAPRRPNGHETFRNGARGLRRHRRGRYRKRVLGFMIAAGQSCLRCGQDCHLALRCGKPHRYGDGDDRRRAAHQIEDSTSGSRKILTREELAALLPPTRPKTDIVFTNVFLTFCMSDISRCSANPRLWGTN